MRTTILSILFLLLIHRISPAQQNAIATETTRVFKTYPFSDPDPIPQIGRIYPYFRYDGYTTKPVQKAWKVVELENDYLRITILPEVGGKVWSAIEKSTGKSYIYDNHTVKFRDVAMRGPWTSGGIEPNYGIIGHTPNCATPVDYMVVSKPDGSVSCIIGVLDLLTRTSWRIDINLPKDKAYLSTTSLWYNTSPFEQPYYTWMNTGIKTSGNLEFIFPGNRYIGHNGEYGDWPVNRQNGKKISFYEQNDFGGPKSYHVFGKYTDFFGAYYHDEDFGMGRYSNHSDKAGKKIWIWGLSREGMIWEKLLTDTSGQYAEVQSGRSFNQAAGESTFTPFKHKGFLPHTTDVWTEYWFPVLKTKGMVAANNYGSLNVARENDFLKIYFSPLQKTDDALVIKDGDKVLYTKQLQLNTLELFSDSIKADTEPRRLLVTLGNDKLRYTADPASGDSLKRPVHGPPGFDYKGAYGLYIQGKEDIRQREYVTAEEKLKASLQKEPHFVPALESMAMLMYRKMQYDSALNFALQALSMDTYAEAANYYYGLINTKLGRQADAKDGFDIASLGTAYRSAAYTELAKIYLKAGNFAKAREYAHSSIDYNRYASDAYQLLAVLYRLQKDSLKADRVLDSIAAYDPLNHFIRFERFLWKQDEENKKAFTSLVRNELPVETYLELAIWYFNAGVNREAAHVLRLAPANAEVRYWAAFLENQPLDMRQVNPEMVFPFRSETAEVLRQLVKGNDHWLLKYHLALIEWSHNNIASAKELFQTCGNAPAYAPFYAGRANFYSRHDSSLVLNDLQQAITLDKNQWRYGRNLVNYFLATSQYAQALETAEKYHNKFKGNYVLAILYARALVSNQKYSAADKLLKNVQILPNEGATYGRELYKETELMLAVEAIKKSQYSKALQYIASSRVWPENLGTGKPYPSDIDERLEDWLAYETYKRQGNESAAKVMLDKIVSGVQATNFPINNLVTAWALQQSGKPGEAEKLVNDWIEKAPNDVAVKWAVDVFRGKFEGLPGNSNLNVNARVLQELLPIYQER